MSTITATTRVAIIAVTGSAAEQAATVLAVTKAGYRVSTDPSFVYQDGQVLELPASQVRELNEQGCLTMGTAPYHYCGTHFTKH